MFKKFILLIAMCFMLTGCSNLIPSLKFGNPVTTPEVTTKSKAKYTCKGKIEYYQDGRVKSCSKGYYAYDEGYNRAERRYTIVERIKNFINNLTGFSFWLFIIAVIGLNMLTGGVAGIYIGKFIESTIGLTGKAFRAVIKGVQKTRKEGIDLNTALDGAEDEEHKAYIRKIKEKEKIK